MKKSVFLLMLSMLMLSACQTTQGTTNQFNQVFKDSPIDLTGR